MYQAPRGTADILPENQSIWNFVSSTFRRIARTYGYERIDTPVFEATDLFLRTVGTESDIAQKEMYSFQDRGGQSVTLRPEGTAAVCRAYLERGLHNRAQPARLFYLGSMFRYDRPQAGRFRQFHQFGVEAIGESDPALDFEVIQLAMTSMRKLGLTGLRLKINSIGDAADRREYLEAIREYFRSHVPHLSQDDRRRFESNPLRLLDSKELAKESILESVPKSIDYLGESALAHWTELISYLDSMQVAYELDAKLVRGLDYYSRTVFEIHPTYNTSQSAVCAGGRYDGLIEQLGGKPTPGIGFAAGIERIIMNLVQQGVDIGGPTTLPIVFAYSGSEAKAKAIRMATSLRDHDFIVLVAPERSLKSQMRYASTVGARTVVILGPEEIARGTVTVRDMQTAEQIIESETELTRLVSHT